MEQKFQHLPLQEESSIRLLKVSHEKHDDQISCTIQNFNPDNTPPYRALSYVWGNDPKKTRQIYLNGVQFGLHENLWVFLNQLWLDGRAFVRGERSDDDCEHYYWTDAICLDQSNSQEIGAQVARMGHIYSEANSVIIWLGAGGMEKSLRCVADFEEAEDSYLEALERTGDMLGSLHHAQQQFRDSGIMQAASSFIDHPYWERTWIVQEAVLAKVAMVKCGSSTMSLDDIQSRLLFFKSSRSDYNTKPTMWKISSARNTELYSNDCKPEYGGMLWKLLMDFELSKCQRKIDKVYGLVGLASILEERRLQHWPNFRLTPIDVNFGKDPNVVFWDTLFGVTVPTSKLVDFICCMGRMFFDGGIDMWDFRNLEMYASRPESLGWNRIRVWVALWVFNQVNHFLNRNSVHLPLKLSDSNRFSQIRDIVPTQTRTTRLLHGPAKIGAALALISPRSNRAWALRKDWLHRCHHGDPADHSSVLSNGGREDPSLRAENDDRRIYSSRQLYYCEVMEADSEWPTQTASTYPRCRQYNGAVVCLRSPELQPGDVNLRNATMPCTSSRGRCEHNHLELDLRSTTNATLSLWTRDSEWARAKDWFRFHLIGLDS